MAKNMTEIHQSITKGPFRDDWASLERQAVPSWFKDAKFGIFIHWGLYSIPAFRNEWYSRNMYLEGSEEFIHHIHTYGPQEKFGYKDFIPLFTADRFDPDDWAKIIQRSGARYVCPVAEHHEGFQMYQSSLSRWNSYMMGPKRDILHDLKLAFERHNMVFTTSSHRAEHWYFMNGGTKFPSDISPSLEQGDFYWPAMPEGEPYDFQSKPEPHKAFLEDWLMRSVEIIDLYHPKMLYLDWWVQHQAFKPYLKMLAAYYYNQAIVWNAQVMICYKHDALAFGCGIKDIERRTFREVKHFSWQTDTSIANNSWCHTNQLDYKSAGEIISMLIDVVSKNGNLLLNIGPKADGTIPEYEVKTLETIGRWLATNQEAIYGSRPYETYGEGPAIERETETAEESQSYTDQDFRFTVNHGYVYAIAMHPGACTRFMIRTLRKALPPDHHGIYSNIRHVSLLGSDEMISFLHDDSALHVTKKRGRSPYPIIFKIEFQ
ncbi:MAG: alpha-L-fucosidase [Candidatus Izemoplasmatales bacterium]|jgi:alpha-L-fucosidase